jgi:hypothetical protein
VIRLPAGFPYPLRYEKVAEKTGEEVGSDQILEAARSRKDREKKPASKSSSKRAQTAQRKSA